MNPHPNDRLSVFDIGRVENDPQLALEFGPMHLTKNIVRVAWLNPTTKEVSNIWEVKWDQDRKHSHAVTRVNIREGFKQLVFVFPDFIIGLRQHFEYNFRHYNFVFDPTKLDESNKIMDKDQFITIDAIEDSVIYSIKKMVIVYHLVD